MKEILKLSLALGGFSAVAGTLLLVAAEQTREVIAATQQAQQSKAFRQVLPPFANQPMEEAIVVASDEGEVVFYRAREAVGGPVTALAVKASARGFGGPVDVLIGLELDGRVRKVMITSHQETPGLGTQVTDRLRRATIGELLRGERPAGDPATTVAPNGYLDQYERFVFDGRVDIRLGNDLKPVSGATISSAAIARAVNQAARLFAERRSQLLK